MNTTHWRGFLSALAGIGLLLLAAGSAIATIQIGDRLVVDGQEIEIQETPLSSFMDPKLILDKLKLKGWCSANWRGYVATWEVRKAQLLLTAIRTDVCGGRGTLIPANRLFGAASYPIAANWFTGQLTSLTGRNWHEKSDSSNESSDRDVYRYEIRTLDFMNGTLTRDSVSVISTGQ